MIELECLLYDGQSAGRHKIILSVDDNGWVHRPEPFTYSCLFEALSISDRIGNIPRRIGFDDGLSCETVDNDKIDQLVKSHCPKPSAMSLVFHLENRWRWALLAFVLIIPLLWLISVQGVPFVARHIAFQLPMSLDSVMGKDALDLLDKAVFEETEISEQTQQRIIRKFEEMQKHIDSPFEFQLKFRHSERLGANAFALPAGIIILTDDFVKVAEHDDEILAVLAHEVGHVIERHGLRSVLQNTVVATVIIAATGDVSWIAAALPTLLIDARHSRQFESEADLYALKYMKKQGIALHRFPDILKRLEANYYKNCQQDCADGEDVTHFFSSHPTTSERERLFNSGTPASIQ